MSASTSTAPGLGAYGLLLPDLAAAGDLLIPAPPGWSPWRIFRETAESTTVRTVIGDDVARLAVAPHGTLVLERDPGSSTFTTPAPLIDAELIHPHLASSAAIAARWQGRESFHAGGFVIGRRVWGVLGDREHGKSSLLAVLAEQGIPIVSDDLLVIRDGYALAGPRCIDLREGAARHLGGGGSSIGCVGTRERWRVPLGPVASELPMAGWVTLEWGTETTIAPVPPGERFPRLLDNLTVILEPRNPPAVLDLAAMPMVTLRRARNLQALAATASRLVDHLDRSG